MQGALVNGALSPIASWSGPTMTQALQTHYVSNDVLKLLSLLFPLLGLGFLSYPIMPGSFGAEHQTRGIVYARPTSYLLSCSPSPHHELLTDFLSLS